MSLIESYKYIVKITEAYKNGFITKDEYKDIRNNEMVLCALRTSKLKIPEILIHITMYAETMIKVQLILSQANRPIPNNNFKSGCHIISEHREKPLFK